MNMAVHQALLLTKHVIILLTFSDDIALPIRGATFAYTRSKDGGVRGKELQDLLLT